MKTKQTNAFVISKMKKNIFDFVLNCASSRHQQKIKTKFDQLQPQSK